ncbi:hypothetical protein C8Q70DRAFT_1089640 [Cubamyces menziesii]|nr:hypothetical protein C8Q70DRAFT_1089640 [Cubamyces menziesii]
MPAKRLQITNGDEHEEHLDDTIALLSLIAAFTLEDVNEIKAQQDAKGQDGALTDEELALQLFAEEAGALDAMANDMLVAQSLDRALKADAGLLEEFARMEETARRDREYAIAISQGRRPTYQARTESCVICRDVIEGPVIRAPCGDTYDVGCLVDLYRAATVDESLFPPACCRQPFEFDKVRVHFDNALIKLVDSKTIEFGTKNRDAALLALAEQTDWKRCPSCGHLIELTIGCYHMTCRCRHQFCYLCTATWRRCSYRQWDDDRLLAAAERRVQRQGVQAPAQGGNAVEFRQRVAREAERLREDHDCEHRWRYIVTEGRCEGCYHYLRLFLFQCRGCQMWVCARCRRNRWL